MTETPSDERALLVELYRTGRGPHWDPKRDRQRPEVLLWRCYVSPGFWQKPPLVLPVKYPYGHHWLIKEVDGTLLAVVINEAAPTRALAEIWSS